MWQYTETDSSTESGGHNNSEQPWPRTEDARYQLSVTFLQMDEQERQHSVGCVLERA
jgi:hypothetical protein